MPVQFNHQRLAEAHDFQVALALRIEIRPALASAHRQAGQSVLEALLETQELQDAQRHVGMESQPAFVGTDGVVELDSPGAIGADVACVVLPADPEDDDPVGLGHAFQDAGVFVLLVVKHKRHQRDDHFIDGLMKLRLAGVPLFKASHERLDFGLNGFRCRHDATPCCPAVKETVGAIIHKPS